MNQTLDLNSLSLFWIRLSEKLRIIDCSNEFRSFINLNGQDLFKYFEFIQPNISQNQDYASYLSNKIIILKHLTTKRRFRFTMHQSGCNLILIGWPIFKNLEEVKINGFSSIINHPACQLSDLLILKDILNQSQKKITGLETQKLNRKIKEQQSINEHQSKLASLGELAAGVAHEINNPLTIVIGYNQVLKRILKNEKDYLKYQKILDKKYNAYLRIKKIVDSLRYFSRKESEKNEIFSIKQAVDNVLELISDLYSKDGITITTTNDGKDYKTFGSFDKFQQILLNLISNAKDATEGKNHREIKIDISKVGSNTRVSICDNGTGIEPKLLQKIFDPFFTTKDPRKGTGLGLGLVNKMINDLNGKIIVKSELGLGSEFVLFLPQSP